MIVNSITITVNGLADITEAEIKHYIDCVHQQTKAKVKAITISEIDGGDIALDYTVEPVKFERIRRITGYLVGSLDKWGNSKQMEQKDRIKHGSFE